MKAAWFFVKVEEWWAPWAFSKAKDPMRVIAALELLGTLFCVMFLGKDWGQGGAGAGSITGSTDNQGNSYAAAKLMSCKWPLTILVMELSQQLKARGTELHLRWRCREENVEADDLTNQCFNKFNPALRINIDVRNISWLVLPELMEASEELYGQIIKERAAAGPGRKWKAMSAAKRLRVTQPW